MILTLSRTGNTRITLPGIFLPIALYSNIQDNQTVYIICYVISKHISVIFQSFSIFVTTIVAVQRLCICAFPFKTWFIFTMRNTVIALVTTFFICVMMTLPSMDHLWWAQSYIYHIFEIYGLMFSWVSRSEKDF